DQRDHPARMGFGRDVAHRLLLQLEVPDAEIERRRAAWTPPPPRYTRGVLAKFARNAASASRGAVLDAD
ncbi:MAG: dihydroxy-acid dehydratase, partial [Pseudomonadota bacterium]